MIELTDKLFIYATIILAFLGTILIDFSSALKIEIAPDGIRFIRMGVDESFSCAYTYTETISLPQSKSQVALC